MTLEEHLENVDDLAIALHHLNKVYDRCQSHYPKSHRLMKLLNKLMPGVVGSMFSRIRGELDNEYNKSVNDEQFRQHGFIYDNLHERYVQIREDVKADEKKPDACS